MTRPAVADSISGCRAVIDTIDDAVFQMLEYRAAVVEAVQQHKLGRVPAGARRGPRARDRRTAFPQAPRLGDDRVDRLVHAIIDECLDAVSVWPQAVA